MTPDPEVAVAAAQAGATVVRGISDLVGRGMIMRGEISHIPGHKIDPWPTRLG